MIANLPTLLASHICTRQLFPVLLAALLLGSCGPIVQIGAKSPPAEALLLIEADARPAGQDTPAAALSGPTVAVELPQLPSMLQTLRLAVRTSDNEVQYLSAASWAETPSRLVQRLLSDTLAARGMAVIDRSQASARADAALSGTLRQFTLDVRGPAPVVIVRFDAQLTRPGTARPLAIRRFDASEPVASEAPVDVAAALSRATNRLAADLADWTGASL
jgi:cholesterol transport system auxiliary component